MLKIREAIVVEGRYDKNTLSQLVDAVIVETNGFGIYKDREKLALLRLLAEKQGLIIFTDSDGAGFQIRGFLKGAIDKRYLKHAYIPDIPGKEKRKRTPSGEGMLGVEGMTPEIITEALRRAGATVTEGGETREMLTKADFFRLGLAGMPDSAEKRQALQKALHLPQKLSANALLEILNCVYGAKEAERLFSELSAEN